MAPPDETSVNKVPAFTKDAEVEKADKQRLAEEEDVPTLRSSSLDNIVDKNVNQELNQEVNQGVNQQLNQRDNQEVNKEISQGINQELNRRVNQKINRKVKKRLTYTHWSKEEEKIVRDIIYNHKINPETFRLDLEELDKYTVKKLAEAGFVRTESGVSFFRVKHPCEVDYSLVCDLVANMPESISAMEEREKYERAAANASEPVRIRSTIPFQSASSLQEWDTLSGIKNSRFAINGKRNYEEYNDGPAGDSTNTVSSAAAAAAAARKSQAQANPTGTNGIFHPVTIQQAFLTTSGSKSYEVAKTQSEMVLNMPSPSKRMCVANGSKENPIEIRDDSPSPQQQSESDRIEKARASLADLKNDLLDCFRIKHWSEKTVMICETRLKDTAEMTAKYTKVAKEKVDEMFRIQELNPEFRDFKPFG
ncbi:uncharacterized protein EAE97_005505 [Botrytis byssoidea]|uniref:Uncharacterized protein n=1 Tax=Botrytis byssoidea TaxID=139641 RepID=A0A9P5IKM2_9HELO|nr:uncharacterized protein EAE97_005505 [Botrytis byssoidea]KAF7944872.1 hypothetical protein EAE97_005505 [Botrytis byssoidea]